jgi:hypothetical protein
VKPPQIYGSTTLDLIDPHHVQEIFFDGIAEVKTMEGVVRFAVFSRLDGMGVVVARLGIPLGGLPDMIQALVLALAEAARN